MSTTAPQKEKYWLLRKEGFSQQKAANLAGFSLSTAKRLEGDPANGREYQAAREERKVPDVPVPLSELDPLDAEAMADRSGMRFCKRFFGYTLSPFQSLVWAELEDAYDSGDREYLCLNGPPGLGKSTVFVMFAAKCIVRNRAIRVLFMSRAYSLAVRNTGRLRRALERVSPAVGAETTLSAAFGRFKPRQGGDVWRRDEYVVEQMDGTPIEEKEPTCAAFGFDAEWLGNRIDLLFGDDLDSTRTINNMETVARNREVYDGELEPRLEGGGLFVIGQQRLGPFDFSAHVLSKVILPDDDGSGDEVEGTRMYRHLVYKVHYDELCKGVDTHRQGSPAYPDGCLLDPERMSWRDVRKAMHQDRFRTVYQQEDQAVTDALVKKVWVDGGMDPETGEMHLGCWDKDRTTWELPKRADGSLALDGHKIGVVTVDPSPTKYWSVQAWVYHPQSEQRFLLDLHRERMEAPDFLDWSHHLGGFTGIADDWWKMFGRLGIPLQFVVVERNAAQRFMLQYDHFHRWMQQRGVSVIAHECVDTETEVLSARGWLRSHEVVQGDEILTLNIDTARSEWKPVNYVYRGWHEGQMHRYATQSIDALCTLNHKWPRTDQSLGPIRLVESQNLNTNSVLPLARPSDHDPAPIYTDDLVELIGWAVTEGHFRKNPKSPNDTAINIGQSRRKNPENCERIRLLLKRLGARWNEHDNHSGYEVSVFSVTGPVATAVRQITNHTKHLPTEFILALSASQRQLLADVLVAGDGWSTGTSRSFCSSTESLATAFEMLCALDGKPTSRAIRKANTDKRLMDHYVVHEKTYKNSYMQNVGNRPVVEDFVGEIWCPNTDNGTFYARRNGKTYFTGNTSANKAHPDYGVQMVGPKWRHGQVRLPGKPGPGRIAAMRLVDEVLRFPNATTTDCVMGEWFLEHAIATGSIGIEEVLSEPVWVPSWMRGVA